MPKPVWEVKSASKTQSDVCQLVVYGLKDVVRVSLQSVVEDECVAAFGGPGVRQDGSRVLIRYGTRK